MKKLFTLFLLFNLALSSFAQAPQKINFQAVLRNATGIPVDAKTVKVRLTVLNNNSAQFTEIHNLTTTSNGLINLLIGGGSASLGTFSAIDWATGVKKLKVEVDLDNNNNYTAFSETELVSVPYALSSADNQWTVVGNDITSKNTGNIGLGGTPNASAKLDISATNKGILIPRIAKANRPTSPATGLLIYQTDDTPGFYFYNSTAWKRLNDEASSSTGGGAIIPFSSGSPITMTTTVGGLTGTSSVLGFGNSGTGISIDGGVIDLTGASSGLVNFAFTAPRNGTLNSINGFFSTTVALSLVGTTLSVGAQLYSAAENSNSFSLVPGANFTLAPALTGVVSIGTTSSASVTGLAIPVTAGKRYLLVFSTTASGLALINTLVGYASAGINIQ